jgi:hypothetical protein
LEVRELLAHDPVRLDDADRILPRVEPADLHEERVVRAHTVLLDELVHERLRHVEVLDRQRIDARWCEHDAVHLQRARHEFRHRPNRRVVLLHERTEELEHLLVGLGEVDVTPPDPLRALRRHAVAARVVAHRGGLRVVDHHEVPFALELQRVVEHAFQIDVLHLRRPLDVGALQRVVDGFGDGEEFVAAVHHVPFGVDADVS